MTDPAPPVLRLTGVRKSFGSVPALSGVSLEVRSGSCTAILGPSGCGKTTLLRIVAGLERADAGRVEIGGTVTDDPAPRLPPEKRRVGLLFQDLALWPHMSIREGLDFVLRASGDGKADRAGRLAAAVEAVHLPASLLDRRPGELSGGERQRAALARALVQRPVALLLDEPLSGLDRHLRIHLLATLREVGEAQGLAMLVVTHDREEAFALADRVALLRDGELEQEGSPADLYTAPRTRFAAEFVGAASLLPVRREGAVGRTALSKFSVQDAPDGPLLAVYRPEAVRIVTDPDDGDGCRARVADCFYRGDHWMLRLDINDSAGNDADGSDRLPPLFVRASEAHGRGTEVALVSDPPPLVAGEVTP